MRAKFDEEIFAWASAERRWLLTENVKDFRPIMLRALSAGLPGCGLLFTSSRAFPGSRKNPGPLINALHAWLTEGPPSSACNGILASRRAGLLMRRFTATAEGQFHQAGADD